MIFRICLRKPFSFFLMMFIGFSSVVYADGKIQYGKNIYYKGSVNSNNIPSGKGKLVTDYKVTDQIAGNIRLVTNKDILEGIFENGTVKEAKLVLGRYNGPLWINAFVFKGTVEYSVSNDGQSVAYTMIEGKITDSKYFEYSVTPDNTFSVIRCPKSNGCDLESGKIRVIRNGSPALFALNCNFTMVNITEYSTSPIYSGQQGYRPMKEKFVLDVDTTTAEGKYEAAAKLYSQKNLAGWSNDDYEELRSLGFNLLKNSAAADYAPALYTMGRLIFSNDPDPVNDRMYLKSFEKLAEKSGSQAIEAMLYLQKNYMIGANNIDNTYMNPQGLNGKARYVGPVDLKKSRYYLEKILANESALKYYVRKGGGLGRQGAELDLNDLNKAIGDRPYKDFAGEISKKIIGTWKMAVYDGITSIYTFRSDGTFKATHTYTYPQLSSGVTVKFEVTGKWRINNNNSVELSDYNRFQNIKASCTSNDFYVRRTVNKLNAPGDDKYAIISDMVRQCSGNLNYIGWMEHNTFSGLVFSNNQMKGSYNTWNIFKEVTLTKISTQAKKPVSKRR